MWQWINEHQALLWSLSGASIAMLIASVIVIPILVVRIRPDYFAHVQRPQRRWADSHSVVRTVIVVSKNLLGLIMIMAGLVMVALPGPGLLTILVGFFLVDFPGKYRVEQWLVRRQFIHRPINWLRRRAGRSPIQVPARSVQRLKTA